MAERYTMDSIASITWLIEDQKFPEGTLARILLALIPADSYLINLECDYETILNRRGELAEPFNFIQTQRQVYARFSNRHKMLTINTASRGIAETHLIIRDLVLNHLRPLNPMPPTSQCLLFGSGARIQLLREMNDREHMMPKLSRTSA